ncbi:MAG: aldo/keto reductase, partial [Gammaproteobacteria bacterium]|nr:aldo/keto reductase [Gammaproteobacteria bacterium]
LFNRRKVESEYRNLYREIGLGTTIWSPLASGVLTGKYNHGLDAEGRLNLPGYEWLKSQFEGEAGQAKLAKTRQLSDLAKELGLPLHHLAIAWCLKNPNVSTVILGASNLSQLQDNLHAPGVAGKLDDDAMQAIEDIVDNQPEQPINWSQA